MAAPSHRGARFVTVDVDGPVHYADLGGPADGPTVVCVHGLGGSYANWLAVGPDLARDCRVVAVDLVGHGLTPTAGRAADLAGHRRLLGGFLAEVAAGPVILMGNSMGGLVSVLQAGAEPGSVAGLVLVDPALPTANVAGVDPRVVANYVACMVPALGEFYLGQRRRFATPEQSVRRVLDLCCVDASRIPPDVVEAHILLKQRQDRAATDSAYLASARSLSRQLLRPFSFAPGLRRIEQPTLLLHGARDRLVPLTSARRVSSARPSWRFEIAEGVGHVPMLEAPGWTLGVVRDWLGGDGAPAARRTRGAIPERPPRPVSAGNAPGERQMPRTVPDS